MKRTEPNIMRSEVDQRSQTKADKMMNLMAGLANTDTGKYQHAFCMLVDKNLQPTILAMRPDSDEALMISKNGAMIFVLSNEREYMASNIDYIHMRASDCDKVVNIKQDERIGVTKMIPVDIFNPKSENFAQAQQIVRSCEAYWINPPVIEMTVEELIDAF
jgi:hypothetical protein